MEECKRIIQGYLECDGSIVRISSLEDIKDFLSKYGKAISEMSESELDELTKKNSNFNDYFTDDCDISYTESPLVLQVGTCIESYKIKEGTVAIADEAFKLSGWSHNASRAIKNIYIPDSVIAIGKSAFAQKENLVGIYLPKALIKIGDSAFVSCHHIEQLQLPISLKYIGGHAFQYTNIKSISFPDNVQKIGSFAFAGCSNLESIEFNGLPKIIGSEVFSNCTALREIIIPQGTKAYFEKELFPISKELFVEK